MSHGSASRTREGAMIRFAPLAFVVLALLALVFLRPIPVASQSGGTLMSGYIWSDTIGWISLSGSGYGISIASNGTLSGYAWSDTIGWISANSGDLAGCPSAPCTATETNNVFSGWLKAIAGGGTSNGGWDGFISLSGSGYGVIETNGVVSGYAWGSTNVGWIDFSGTAPFAPVCTLAPNTPNIVQGNTATLIWTSSRTTSGSIAPGSIAMVPIAGGNVGVQPNATTTYTGTFTGSGGSVQCNATINVSCAAIYSCSGSTITYKDQGCGTRNIATCSAPSFCSAGQPVCQWPAITFTPYSGTITGHLQARPSIIHPGAYTHLYWNIASSTGCSVTGNGSTWNTTSSGAGGVQTNTSSTTQNYVIHCTAYSGQSDLNDAVTVIVDPSFQEQ